MKKKILITGGTGYVGSYLIRTLLDDYDVTILDNFRFGEEPIKEIKDKIQIVKADLRNVNEALLPFLKDTYAIVHLGGLSKEPTFFYDTRYAIDVNYVATQNLASLAKRAGVKKFIFASSCSIYFSYALPEIPKVGKQYYALNKSLPLMKETDNINPISPYSISKRASEQALLDLADDNFRPTILRKGTIFGLSPRMRFDLVVNALVKTSFFDNQITVLDGIFRPLVDIDTVAKAYKMSLEKNFDKRIINVVDFNIDLISLAEKVKKIIPADPKINVKEAQLERNYRASKERFNKYFNITPRPFEKAVMEIWNFLKENPEDKPIYYNKNL